MRVHPLSGNRVTKAFCPNCGGQVLGRNSGSTGYVTVSLGTQDDSSALQPQVAIFARNRKPWDMMDETIATFDDQPGWKPDGK